MGLVQCLKSRRRITRNRWLVGSTPILISDGYLSGGASRKRT
jgi:hypothetical protein